ncbi:uncharacterized protein LOC132659217 isoform X2 [Ovis aries]|uniref:uncharacterized protein LOC132659217 isoform X2 n=1 Tax=Ovis aries TaxID=9940 RepID=UPI0029527CE3|nr:uncharacterized protein LOC132659217 isoform X2 [Ovis aries]
MWQGKSVTPGHLPFQEAEPLQMPQKEKPALPHMALQWPPPWTSELWLLLLDGCPQPWREHGCEDLKGSHLSPRKQEEDKSPSASGERDPEPGAPTKCCSWDHPSWRSGPGQLESVQRCHGHAESKETVASIQSHRGSSQEDSSRGSPLPGLISHGTLVCAFCSHWMLPCLSTPDLLDNKYLLF